MWLWITIALLVVLFETWYVSAFLFAFFQLRERRVLLLVFQGLFMWAAFLYISYSLITAQPFIPLFVFAPLIIALVLQMIWRLSTASLARFWQSYPRGFLDVLFFRRPKLIDLKRRVRTR